MDVIDLITVGYVLIIILILIIAKIFIFDLME
jgi:hypothetical protein